MKSNAGRILGVGFLACALLALQGAGPATHEASDASGGAGADLLGEEFNSKTMGIAFRAPAGCKKTPSQGENDLVEYKNDANLWKLQVSRSELSKHVPLLTRHDPKTGEDTLGMVNIIAGQMEKLLTAQILRKDIINIGENDVGLVIARFTLGADQYLRQQAMVQVSERFYYILDMTTPSGPSQQGADATPEEKKAIATFNAVLGTIKIIDLTPIRQDQNIRLYNTRALFVDWTPEKLNKILKEKQYFLLLRDGRDFGYSFMEEVPDHLDQDEGVNVYIRACKFVDKDETVEVAAKMFSTFNRQHERWAHVGIQRDGKGNLKDHFSEWGDSDYRQHVLVDPRIPKDDEKDKGQPGNIHVVTQPLDVVYFGKRANAPPVHFDLPPMYLPQALGQMLPWLVPLKEPKNYMFAYYLGDTHTMMFRYVDVSAFQKVQFNGKTLDAQVVSDRIGLEGEPTLHYFDEAGNYLGYENKAEHTVMIPTTAEEILKIWPNAVLSRSEETEHRPDEGGAGKAPELNR